MVENWSLTSLWDETFFVQESKESNLQNYKNLLEEQVRIAYVTGAGINFSEIENMSTEDRKILIEVLKQIKEEEKEEMKKSQSKSSSSLPPALPTKASSKNFTKNPVPRISNYNKMPNRFRK